MVSGSSRKLSATFRRFSMDPSTGAIRYPTTGPRHQIMMESGRGICLEFPIFDKRKQQGGRLARCRVSNIQGPACGTTWPKMIKFIGISLIVQNRNSGFLAKMNVSLSHELRRSCHRPDMCRCTTTSLLSLGHRQFSH